MNDEQKRYLEQSKRSRQEAEKFQQMARDAVNIEQRRYYQRQYEHYLSDAINAEELAYDRGC
jgi:hypothetical protein